MFNFPHSAPVREIASRRIFELGLSTIDLNASVPDPGLATRMQYLRVRVLLAGVDEVEAMVRISHHESVADQLPK